MNPDQPVDWRTKPTDRFVLKWIKLNLSARVTPRLMGLHWLRPWMITFCSTCLGMTAGVIFGLNWAWLAGLVAAGAQVLDGVDGQFARLSGRSSVGGAFWDSVLDRYADGAMMIGLVVYLIRLPLNVPDGWLITAGALALIGSSLVSYSTARATSLGIELGGPTLVSKGTRWTAMILTAWGSLLWAPLPAVALVYLILHPNYEILRRLLLTRNWMGE